MKLGFWCLEFLIITYPHLSAFTRTYAHTRIYPHNKGANLSEPSNRRDSIPLSSRCPSGKTPSGRPSAFLCAICGLIGNLIFLSSIVHFVALCNKPSCSSCPQIRTCNSIRGPPCVAFLTSGPSTIASAEVEALAKKGSHSHWNFFGAWVLKLGIFNALSFPHTQPRYHKFSQPHVFFIAIFREYFEFGTLPKPRWAVPAQTSLGA